MYEFISSLGVIGYFLIGVLGLALWKLRSPLDSPQHKAWRNMGGLEHPDYLDPPNDH